MGIDLDIGRAIMWSLVSGAIIWFGLMAVINSIFGE